MRQASVRVEAFGFRVEISRRKPLKLEKRVENVWNFIEFVMPIIKKYIITIWLLQK